MKKRMMVLILVAVVVYILVGRDAGIKYRLGQDLQLDLFWGKITTYFDNHAHVWHNDGATVAVLRFSEKNAKRLEESLEQSIVWSRTPMSEEFYYVAYERSHTWAEPELFVDMAKVPEITNGHWFFVDQDTYRNGTLVYGQKALERLNLSPLTGEKTLPGSYCLALYDLDTHTLYYFQRDL